ncbi:hypothetical protein EB73_34065 [Mycobacterium sp. SWH-M3]|nr:hypothetical protein EB73_34065 [Mycobacterium sp. SWH-M3]
MTEATVQKPTVGECPAWCELPEGHGWDDEWPQGLGRFHTWRRQIGEHHAVEVREIEQQIVGADTIRTREVVLDVESPTQWDIATAEVGLAVLAEAVTLARSGRSTVVGDSEVR